MKKNYKLKIFIILLIAFFSIFLYFFFKPYDYKQKYNVDGYKILEEYNTKEKVYTFIISKDNINYPFVINNKYIHNKDLIDKIKVKGNDQEVCILPESNVINFYPICSSNNELYVYNLSNKDDNFYKLKDIKQENNSYNKIDINYLNNYKYLIYNYKGYYLISNKNKKEIKLFSKDNYNINLVYKLDKYLLVADYNSDYYFHKFYLINSDNGKVTEINMEYDISFDSIFLGDYKNKIYLLDKKEKKEYVINIKKEKVLEIDFQILKNNKLVKTTYNKIINNNLSFIPNENKYYVIENNMLYKKIEDIKIKVTNSIIDKIIDYIDNTIFYISKENLYMYNETYGEVLLLTNFEWNFNNNGIYVLK